MSLSFEADSEALKAEPGDLRLPSVDSLPTPAESADDSTDASLLEEDYTCQSRDRRNAVIPETAETQIPSSREKPASLNQGIQPNGTAAISDNQATAKTAIFAPTGVSGDDVTATASPQQSRADDLEAEIEEGLLPVLRNRKFLALWSGQVFSQLADKIYLVLMIAIITSQFQEPGQTISGWVSAIMIAFTIPAVLFGSLAGAFVDRWPKKTVLASTNLLRGGLVLTLPVLLWLSQGIEPIADLPLGFGLLLIVTFLVSTLTQFFAPAEQSAIPLVVARRNLLPANSLYTTTMMASIVVGFAVGDPLLAIADTVTNHLFGGLTIGKELLVGGSYAIAGLILLLLRTGEKIDPASFEATHILADLREGLRYLTRQRQVRTALIQQIILFSIFAALAVLAVRLAEIIPTLKTSQFGVLLAAGGVGMGIGAAIVGQFGQRLARFPLAIMGSMGMAVSLAGLAIFSQELWFAIPLIASIGIFAAFIGIPMQTVIQEKTPEDMRGKVFGLQNNAANIALSLPLALAGVAESMFGLEAVLLALAALAIAGGGLNWYIADTGSSNRHRS